MLTPFPQIPLGGAVSGRALAGTCFAVCLLRRALGICPPGEGSKTGRRGKSSLDAQSGAAENKTKQNQKTALKTRQSKKRPKGFPAAWSPTSAVTVCGFASWLQFGYRLTSISEMSRGSQEQAHSGLRGFAVSQRKNVPATRARFPSLHQREFSSFVVTSKLCSLCSIARKGGGRPRTNDCNRLIRDPND